MNQNSMRDILLADGGNISAKYFKNNLMYQRNPLRIKYLNVNSSNIKENVLEVVFIYFFKKKNLFS